MTNPRDQKIRDPVHGLIEFMADNPLDQTAWQLLDTPEFQRLRRIRQLGVSEFVYPGAVHTRFAHSLGVFHTARKLVDIIERELKRKGQAPDAHRAEVVVLAALLHDIGHGPFSHAFEGVLRDRGIEKDHEEWSAEIIRNPSGAIFDKLERFRPGIAEEIATLLEEEDPTDIYHAVVSSSFDADRLDYLRRDRMMTGTHAGAIDFDWLMAHVRVEEVEIDADEGDGAAKVPTFCLDRKALPAAEQFLLARYTLHEQVYFHKTTRCVEKMISKLLQNVAKHANDPEGPTKTGLPENHPLLRFFATDGQVLQNYLALNDLVIWGAIEGMQRATDGIVSEMAGRLQERQLYKTYDVRSVGPDKDAQQRRAKWIDRNFATEIAEGRVIKDEGAKVSIYTEIGGDDARTHKKLHIVDTPVPIEISKLDGIPKSLATPKQFTRYYFESESHRDQARQKRREA